MNFDTSYRKMIKAVLEPVKNLKIIFMAHWAYSSECRLQTQKTSPKSIPMEFPELSTTRQGWKLHNILLV